MPVVVVGVVVFVVTAVALSVAIVVVVSLVDEVGVVSVSLVSAADDEVATAKPHQQHTRKFCTSK